MATSEWFENGVDSFFGMRRRLLWEGETVAPRGMKTRELRNMTITIENPTAPLMTTLVNRNMNPRLATLEALQLIGGCSSPELMRAAAPNTAKFTDGGYFHGAYGPRLRGQLPKIVQRLTDDPATRQAVATIWDPLHDLHTDGMHDYPCTVYLSWCLRNGRLEQTTHMRSNDLWWGWTYDIVMFTQLQCTLANVLGAAVGPYHHVVDSFHLYERDLEAINAVNKPEDYWETDHLMGLPISREDPDRWRYVSLRARWLLFEPGTFEPVDETESWFHEQMINLYERTPGLYERIRS